MFLSQNYGRLPNLIRFIICNIILTGWTFKSLRKSILFNQFAKAWGGQMCLTYRLMVVFSPHQIFDNESIVESVNLAGHIMSDANTAAQLCQGN